MKPSWLDPVAIVLSIIAGGAMAYFGNHGLAAWPVNTVVIYVIGRVLDHIFFTRR